MTDASHADVVDYDLHNAEALRILPALFRNPLSIPGSTCSVCTAPVEPNETRCRPCSLQRHHWRAKLADIVVPLTYAGPQNRQAQQDLRQYKDSNAAQVRQLALYRLSYLVWYAVVHHAVCLERLHGRVEAITSVPSGRAGARGGGHPVERLALWPFDALRVHLVRVRDAAPRTIVPDSLEVAGDVRGRHVLLFDDTWTTGASTQGAAIALRRAGAAHVSVLVLGRWLNDAWPPTQRFLESRPADELWRPGVCPVTRASCP